MKRRRLIAGGGAALILSAGLLTGCQKPPVQFHNTDITGASFARELSLTDHNGTVRNLTDFAGKLVVVFFGFTHCPDVCPATLIEMKAVMERLGSNSDQVQVLFVTVDPERDTEKVLSQYVPAFDQRFLGLRGDLDAVKKVANEFKVFFAKVPGSTEDTYSVDHTAASYVFDQTGKVRLMIKPSAGVDAIVDDLNVLLQS